MKRRWLLAVLSLTFLFILMPFLFWQASWFGRPLTDAQLEKSLADSQEPRGVQHGLSQVADRILAEDPRMRASAQHFYPDVIRIAGASDDDLRLTAAWVMGQDNNVPEFHQALLGLLRDPNPMVRRNAALGLVRFGDVSGREEIRAIFQPYSVVAPQAGKLAGRLKPGDVVNPGTLLGHVEAAGQSIEIRSQVPGAVQRWLVSNGESVAAQQPVLLVGASSDEMWEALRALYLIGQSQDIPIAERIADDQTEPDNLRDQARRTVAGLRSRDHAASTGSATPATPAPAGTHTTTK